LDRDIGSPDRLFLLADRNTNFCKHPKNYYCPRLLVERKTVDGRKGGKVKVKGETKDIGNLVTWKTVDGEDVGDVGEGKSDRIPM
jgi:hypothetical protein